MMTIGPSACRRVDKLLSCGPVSNSSDTRANSLLSTYRHDHSPSHLPATTPKVVSELAIEPM